MPSTGRDTGYTSIEDRHTEEGAKVPVSKGRPKFLDPAQTLLNRKRIVDSPDTTFDQNLQSRRP